MGLPDTTHLSTQLLKHDRDLGPVMCNDVCPRSVGDVFGSVIHPVNHENKGTGYFHNQRHNADIEGIG